MGFADNPLELSPKEFEMAVRRQFDRLGTGLQDYRSVLRERIEGDAGQYEIDISLRFNALGVDFLLLVECKKYKSKVKRQQVQTLRDTVQAIGADKGIMISVLGYQQGAITYGQRHRLPLLTIQAGEIACAHRSAHDRDRSRERIEPYSFWLFRVNKQNRTTITNLDVLEAQRHLGIPLRRRKGSRSSLLLKMTDFDKEP